MEIYPIIAVLILFLAEESYPEILNHVRLKDIYCETRAVFHVNMSVQYKTWLIKRSKAFSSSRLLSSVSALPC